MLRLGDPPGVAHKAQVYCIHLSYANAHPKGVWVNNSECLVCLSAMDGSILPLDYVEDKQIG